MHGEQHLKRSSPFGEQRVPGEQGLVVVVVGQLVRMVRDEVRVF